MTRESSVLRPPFPDRPGQWTRWGRLYGSSTGLALAAAAERHDGPLLAVAPDTLSATRLEQEVRFFLGEETGLPVLSVPDWETLPYDVFSPHHDIVSDRLAALYRLPTLERGVLILPLPTLMQRLPPRAFLEAHALMLDVGDRLDLDAMRTRLEASGYRYVSEVLEHGDFAVRGSLLDLYPMGSRLPYRIELFDEEVESLRTFDPETQRSLDKVDQVRLLPAREFPLDEEGVRHFRQAFRMAFEGDPQRCPVYRDVSQGLPPPGIEYYLPLFFEETAALFDYLPDSALLATPE
ncbi:MAG TPA: transcription-repair coupling factor, partial [Gammaproteobacteria bacterium]|nr:transcription-repair coupling factor [Gammaproteobacteria bacterium]